MEVETHIPGLHLLCGFPPILGPLISFLHETEAPPVEVLMA